MKVLSLIIFCLMFSFAHSQTEYFVSPTGSDSNSGTELQPWQTLRKAFNSATAGSTVFVKGGIYNEKDTVNVSGNSVDGFITFRPFEDDIVIMDGTGKTGDQMILIEDKSYIKIIGFEIRNNLNQSFGSGIWLKGGGSHIEFRNNTILDMRRTGAGDCMAISIYGTSNTPLSNIVVDSNIIYDCEPGHSEALTLNGNVDTFWVTNNLVHDVNNIGIDMIGGEGTCPTPSLDAVRNGICRGNIVYNAHSLYGGGYAAGIYVDGGINIIVENNKSYSNDVGIEIGCENQGRVSSGMIVRNNLVFDNDKRGIGIGGYDYPATGKVTTTNILNNTCFNNDTEGTGAGELIIEYTEGCIIKNNIFYSTSQNRLMTTTVGNASGNVFDYNLWFAPGGTNLATVDYAGTVYTGFNNYKTGTGQEANSLFANPMFVSTSLPNPDIHLQDGSPAIDAGDPAFVPALGETDYDGNPRLDNSRVDCGAYEIVQLIVSVPTLLRPEDNAVLTSSIQTMLWTSSESGATYHFQVASDSLFQTVIVNDSTIVDTSKQIQLTINGTYFWRVKAKLNNVKSNWSPMRKFIYASANKWFLVSVPLRVSDPRTTTLFPNAISDAFSFDNDAGYTIQDSLENGIGYWLKFGADQTSNITGDSIYADTLEVVEGWNLIGTISVPLQTSAIITEGTTLQSDFYEFESGYNQTETVQPMKGYWIKVSSNGSIILNANVFKRN
ncbi:MAG: right-handed parallel beta-helix repeat-containing protein [Ignavibacteriae bacterium]|nr:right-handed parallel beta-helix repeat-containing protein [Ignavibacteriota bacterium]